MTKIYGICVAQNEGDVIAESLRWAARFCEHIWAWDLGSTDNTGDQLRGLSLPNVTAEHKDFRPFLNSIRGEVFAGIRDQVEEGSWMFVLDPDEFLVGDPHPLLEAAAREGDGIVGAWQINFLPTEKDLAALSTLGEEKWMALPLSKRLRYYRVEWFEHRFARVVPGFEWDYSGLHSRWLDSSGRPLRLSRRFGFVRHYRYRSPNQVAKRHATRDARRNIPDGMFRWTDSPRFADYVRSSRRLLYWDPAKPEVRVPWMELQRARAVWTGWRAVHHLQRRLGIRH